MRTRRRLLLLVTAVAVAASAPGPLAGAQEPPSGGGQVVHSWALAPAGTTADPDDPNNRPNLSYELDPGASVDDAVTLYNYGTEKLTFRLYATDAFNNDDGEFDLLPGTQPPDDVGSWITLGADHLTLEAGRQATVPIRVTVPADADPGDHAGAVLASSEAAGTGPDGKTVTIDRRTGSRVYIRVAGPVEPELAVESVSTTYEPSINPLGGTATVTYAIRNRGNVRLSGEHSVSVSGPLGLFEQRSEVEELTELLPNEVVTVERRFDGVPALAVELTEVRLRPSTDAGAEPDLPAVTRRATTLAPPLTVVFLLLAGWLALRARRAYRRRRAEATIGVGPAAPERVGTPVGAP